MFCTLEDAWGGETLANNTIFNQSDKSDTFKNNEYSPINDNNITEHFSNKPNMYQQYMHLKEMFEQPVQQQQPNQVCVAIDSHLEKCQYCKDKYLTNKCNSFIIPEINLSHLSHKITANSDTITILLFGLLLILILKLFTN